MDLLLVARIATHQERVNMLPEHLHRYFAILVEIQNPIDSIQLFMSYCLSISPEKSIKLRYGRQITKFSIVKLKKGIIRCIWVEEFHFVSDFIKLTNSLDFILEIFGQEKLEIKRQSQLNRIRMTT